MSAMEIRIRTASHSIRSFFDLFLQRRFSTTMLTQAAGSKVGGAADGMRG